MSLPAWNRKAPSRAAIAATISALTVFGASSVASADVTKQHNHSAQAYGQPVAAGYGFPGAQIQGGYANYGFAAPAQQAYGAPVPFPGYGAPVPASAAAPAPAYGTPAQAAPAPQAPAYGAPQPFPGYGLPGQFAPAGVAGFPVPGAPSFGFDPYGAFGNAGQWGNFAPSEPNYAPHERFGGTAAVAPAEPAKTAPAAPRAAAATTSSDYSYEIAPAAGSQYVGNSAQIEPSNNTTTYADPYQSIQQAAPLNQGYQVATPTYTQAYDAATSYAAPAPAYAAPAPAPVPAAPQNYVPSQQTFTAEPQQNYVTAQPTYEPAPIQQTYVSPAPVPAQPAVNVGGYEYQSAQPAADYYDLSAQSAAAAIATPQQVAAYTPQQVAPVGGHFVQVGAFIDQNRAAKLVNRLGAAGEQAFVVPARVRGKIYHRVRIAGGSKRDARAVRNRVRELGYYEARVVKG